jgi:hypothetical protein
MSDLDHKKSRRGNRGGRGRLRVNLPFSRTPYIENKKARNKSRLFNKYCCYIESIKSQMRKKTKIHWEYLRIVRLNNCNINVHINNLNNYKKEMDFYMNEIAVFNNYMLSHGIYEAQPIKSQLNEDVEKNARLHLGDLCDYL